MLLFIQVSLYVYIYTYQYVAMYRNVATIRMLIAYIQLTFAVDIRYSLANTLNTHANVDCYQYTFSKYILHSANTSESECILVYCISMNIDIHSLSDVFASEYMSIIARCVYIAKYIYICI